jgi:catechol 2,3-dioxygenase-like lactoylglutathione lyase family enzyme
MKNLICTLFLLFSTLIFSQQKMDTKKPLVLGVFSVSLKVKDLAKSKEFYEKLGFSSMGGDVKQNYLIMKNGRTLIGLFQGFIDENVLTFNPGWDENAKEVNPFTDVRDIQKSLKKDQIKLDREASETTTGPEYIMLQDPDGNKILIDQHR